MIGIETLSEGSRVAVTERVRASILRLAIFWGFLLLVGAPVHAAVTEPRLALMRVTAYRAAGGAISLTLEGSFSFADAVQLALPLNVVITQNQLSARFDLSGNVFTTMAPGPEQPASGPGIVRITARQITLVLPPGFAAGAATAQITATYGSQPIASNRLGFNL